MTAPAPRRHVRIHPLSGAALAAVLTVPVVVLGPADWPGATTRIHPHATIGNHAPDGHAAAAGAGGGPAGSAAGPTWPAAGAAPGWPGTTPRAGPGRKDCVGTAAPAAGYPAAKVWYTVADGVLSDVYEPTVDNTNVTSLQYIVTDGATFTDLQARDLSYTVSADASGMACTVTATSLSHGYQLVTTYLADPSRDAVLARTLLERAPRSRTDLSALHVYARLDAAVNGDGGANTAAVVTVAPGGPAVPVIYDASGASQPDRGYAVPTYMALVSAGGAAGRPAGTGPPGGAVAPTGPAGPAGGSGGSSPLAAAGGTAAPAGPAGAAAGSGGPAPSAGPVAGLAGPLESAGPASVGYAGSASDGLTQLDAARTLTAHYGWAPHGHVVATLDVTPGTAQGGPAAMAASAVITLALGFGRTEGEALGVAARSARQPFGRVLSAYQQGWRRYDAGLRPPPGSLPGLSPADTARAAAAYYLSANVLKASEDKTFPGAIAASLARPAGRAALAGAAAAGAAGYGGSYNLVRARDLYEAVTALLADGDLATARAAALFPLSHQQLPDGEIPPASLLDGKPAPGAAAAQLSDTADAILMAYLCGLGGDGALWRDHIRLAADFLVAHGPSDGVDRWGEQAGYSPSTIAAEIAGLTAASAIASRSGDNARALLYQAIADDFQRGVKSWTVTTTGPDAPRYFIRVAKGGDPDAAVSYSLGNGGPTLDQRQVLDGGFQELVRLGVLPASDADVRASLGLWDRQMSVATAAGVGYYRYGDAASGGSADGYGDCYQPSQTTCTGQGEPWAATGTGTRHLWPLLSGERAESDIAAGDLASAGGLLAAMMNFSAGVGLAPEQVWADPALAASPYGTDPAVASAGFTNGGPTDSPAPLTWAQAQELRLIQDLGAGQVLDQPDVTADRYVRHPPPAAVGVGLTTPAAWSTVETTTVTVAGTTAPGASLVVESTPTGTGEPAQTVTATAGADGRFSVAVPAGFGTDVVTVAASAADGTGYAQVTVYGDSFGGAVVLDAADPAGDDNGPGGYQYPTALGLPPGSLDLTRFRVIDAGPVVYLQATLGTLAPVPGRPMGGQLLDIYVHTPGALATTAAAAQSRNYSIAPADAWSQRIEVAGGAPPVWVDAAGKPRGDPAVVASVADATITIAVPSAVFGVPASGWSFAVVLTGQDPGDPGQALGFAPTPQPRLFGLCAPGGTGRVCQLNPAAAPAVMDVLTPPGIAQAAELDPTVRDVVIQAVHIP